MWWIILQRDWYLAHGNLEYLQEQREYLTGLLPVLSEQIQPAGTVAWRGRLFLDWPSSDNPDAVHAGLTALLSLALKAGAELCGVLDETSAQEQALIAATRLQVPALPRPNKQASALLALSGLYDANEVNAQILASEPLRGLSTFYGYYVLQARAQAGDHAGCLEVLRRYWGAMLDLGATSFWEDFDLSWAENASRIDELVAEGTHDVHAEYGNYCYKGLRHSLCHGWAAGPTAWLSEHVLGVRPLEPGCRKILVQPHLCDLDWVEGTYPTPHGVIRLRHERQETGEITTRIEAPSGVEVAH
jgi:alpha-L-rhamnosidase